MRNRENPVIGLDVGGTSIKAALVGRDGQIADRREVSVCRGKEPGVLLAQMAEIIHCLINTAGPSEVAGVGIALPGAVDESAGKAVYCPNLSWRDVPVVLYLTEQTRLRVRLVNDANAAVLGEYYYGQYKGSRNLLCLTLGTGLGSGLIRNDRLFSGLGSGVEAGHMIIDRFGPPCSCGARGCWETYVSAAALVREVKERLHAGKASLLRERAAGGGNAESSGLTAEMVFAACADGDEVAGQVIREFKEYLALGMGNLINLFQPERIILAGGIARAGETLLEGLAEKTAAYVYPPFRENYTLVLSELGGGAGILGAASLWLQEPADG